MFRFDSTKPCNIVRQLVARPTQHDGGDAMADTGAVAQEQLEQLLPQVCINQINAIAKSKRACRRVHNDTKRNFAVSDMPFGSR